MAHTPSEKAKLSLEQLHAEIITSEFRSVRAFAAALGIDYNTFRRWLNGERVIPYYVVLESVDKLGLSLDDFNRRVAAREPAGQ